MNDLEYEIIEELYFLSSFETLEKQLDIPEDQLKDQLRSLIEKGWVKCLQKETEVEILNFENFDLTYKNYNYLVTKAGLFAHNSK